MLIPEQLVASFRRCRNISLFITSNVTIHARELLMRSQGARDDIYINWAYTLDGWETLENADAPQSPSARETERDSMELKVRTLFERRAKGDLEGLLELFASDCMFFIRGNWSTAISQVPVRGKAAYAEMLRLLNIQLENLGSIYHEIMIDGDHIMVHRTTSVCNRGSNEQKDYDVIDIIRFRDGLITEFSEYPDTAMRREICP
jgi:ketosteroid isomerase-like protein